MAHYKLPGKSNLNEWWSQLAEREQRMLLVGGVIVALFIVYAGIWSPFLNRLNHMRQHIQAQEKTLVWMQSADKALQSAQHSHDVQREVLSPVQLLSYLQKQFEAAGLSSQLAQLKQSSEHTIEIQFQQVDFDLLMKVWLQILRAQSIHFTQFTVTAESEPGIVNVAMSIEV